MRPALPASILWMKARLASITLSGGSIRRLIHLKRMVDMNTSLFRVLIALFLVAHGLVHVTMAVVPLPQPGAQRTPFWPSWWRSAVDPAWPISRLVANTGVVRGLGTLLWLAAVIGFAAAGLGLLGVPGLRAGWVTLAVGAAAASLLMHVFYWHPWLVVGGLLDLAVLAAIRMNWPAAFFASR